MSCASPLSFWRRVLAVCVLVLAWGAAGAAQDGPETASGLDGNHALRMSQEAIGRQIAGHNQHRPCWE